MWRFLLVVVVASSPAYESSLRAAPPERFDQRVEALRQSVGTPGMAITIVEDGKVTLARGYGVRKLGDTTPVNTETIFPSGSTGKAVTVAALATLVDAGKIDWDDKVIDRLRGFQMYDPWVTREITIRDLLVHRSGLGLGAGDLLFVPRTNIPRAEAVRRLRYIKPATSFRSGYAYDNILYMVAGQLIEEVTGQTWEDYVREHVLAPAGMTRSTTDPQRRYATANRAYPHARTSAAVRGIGPIGLLNERDELGKSAAPAGGLAVSANDMATWLKIQLAAGQLPDGKRLFSEAAHTQMWTPVTIEPVTSVPPSLALTQPNFATYALGWMVTDYRGAKIVWHPGGVFGFVTAVVLIPEKKVGFSIQLNSEDGEIIRGLMFELLDHYLGLPANDWPAKFAAFKKQRLAGALTMVQATRATPAKVGPSLPLGRYTGTYVDPWYGKIEVGRSERGLTIDFKSTPRMSGTLRHWQFDSFVTEFDDKALEPAYVNFAIDGDGKVGQVTMKPYSPTADFSYDYQDLLFTPVASAK